MQKFLFCLFTARTTPTHMCNEIYDCCASPKKKLIVEGAAHAESYYKDTEKYEQALNEFFDEIM